MENRKNTNEWLCSGERHGKVTFWKMLSALGFLMAGLFAFISFCLKKKNDQYRDMMIAMSDEIPDEEEMEIESSRQWHRAHAPANRKTVEERLAEQRVQES